MKLDDIKRFWEVDVANSQLSEEATEGIPRMAGTT
jgi:hypothetical protein